ncbi:DUF1428 domain-containing protein [Reyranella sp.]|uniref:DUF1428 domain-containing protein n=1 Tax=Reyranella sp. TaxID=1929291 RepID=UPI00272FE532|nr:DUF1428 domain-containing protein [Reyranella sp.]MDP2373585.1 DUF1428 domain-containing protein [Reyranella sp.]
MAYVQGFVLPVPADKKEAYRQAAADFSSIAKEFGATRQVEAWGDDVPDGKLTDFKGAVKAKPDEIVVFSWLEFPSKEVADAAHQKIMTDPRMKDMAMPFDGQRMILAGFTPILDEGKGGKPGYVDGFVAAVPAGNKDAHLKMATKAAGMFKEVGAIRVVETWGENVPDGKVTDYKGAVKATADEKIVYSWIEWPSKAVRDEGWKKMMADERMKDNAMPFDGKRMIYGGFAPILDT